MLCPVVQPCTSVCACVMSVRHFSSAAPVSPGCLPRPPALPPRCTGCLRRGACSAGRLQTALRLGTVCPRFRRGTFCVNAARTRWPARAGGDGTEGRKESAEACALVSPLPFSCPRLSLKVLCHRALFANPCLIEGGVATTSAGSEEELFWACADTCGPLLHSPLVLILLGR